MTNKKIILILLLIGTLALSTDFNITTTAHFDAGVKSNSSGNYEIETYTDNYNISPDGLELGNKMGDRFTFADADGNTWKWRAGTTDNGLPYAVNINTKLPNTIYVYLNKTNTSTISSYINSTLNITQPFDIQMSADMIITDGNSHIFNFYMKSNASEYISTQKQVISTSTNRLYYTIRIDGSNEAATFNTISKNISFRQNVLPNATVQLFYNSTGGTDWTLLQERAGNHNYPFWAQIYATVSSVADYQVFVRGYKITKGTPQGNWVRAAGNWTSATQTMPVNKKMSNTTLLFSDISATQKIDKIEWVNASGVILATYDTDITSGTSKIIKNADLTSGTFNDVDSNYKIRIHLVGNGTNSPIITEIFGNYENTAEHGATCNIFADSTAGTFTNYTDYVIRIFSNYFTTDHYTRFRICYK